MEASGAASIDSGTRLNQAEVLRSFPTADSIPNEWRQGDRLLDLYVVRGVLGEGGNARVHRVHHEGWGLDLAAKTPLAKVLNKPGGAESFQREAEAWVDLGLHPHIVTCHYVRRLGGIPRVFAELAEGGSLQDWIDDGRLYAGDQDEVLARILDVAIQFAWGLGYAHEQDLVHQDVKPSNVLLTGVGTVEVTDFGLVGMVGGVAGTLGYLSPEQADAITQAKTGVSQSERSLLTRSTDVWSWALSVMDMFNGELRTRASGVAGPLVLEGYVEDGPDRDGVPRMPERVVGLLRECFQQDSADRPHGFDQIAVELEAGYREVTNEPHPREQPVAAELLADQLNNKAVSLLDLERQEEAEALFEDALGVDPHHLEATYNQGLRQWRRGEITDLDLVTRLEEVRKTQEQSWRAEYLLAQVHIERGDKASAREHLEAACERSPDSAEVERRALAAAVAKGAGWCESIVLEGHADAVTSVVVSPDGRRVVSGSDDGTVRVWDSFAPECLHTLPGHTGGDLTVAVTLDGRYVASGSDDGVVRVWDLETGECLRTFEGGAQPVLAMAISPEGRKIHVATKNKELRVWDIESGQCRSTSVRLPTTRRSVALSQNASWLICVGGPGGGGGPLALTQGATPAQFVAPPVLRHMPLSVGVWDVGKGDWSRDLGPGGPFDAAAVSADGTWVAAGGSDHAVRVWDRQSRQLCATLEPTAGKVQAGLALSRDGRWVVSLQGGVRLWDVAAMRCVRTFTNVDPSSVDISADGRLVASGERDGSVRIWTVGFGDQAVAVLARPQPAGDVLQLETRAQNALADARRELEAGRGEQAAESIRRMRALPGFERYPDALEAMSVVGTLGRRSALSGAWFRAALEGHTRSVGAIAISTDGKSMASASRDGTLRSWDLESQECTHIMDVSDDSSRLSAFALSPDSSRLALGFANGTLRVWSVVGGECLQRFQAHPAAARSVALSRDGSRVVSVSEDRTIWLWDVATGERLATFEGHTGSVESVAFSPSGSHLLSGSKDGNVRVWDIASGDCLRRLIGQGQVEMSPDGRLVITVDSRPLFPGADEPDRRVLVPIRVWNEESEEPTFTLRQPADLLRPGTALAALPDGQWLVVSSGQTLYVWHLRSGELLASLKGPVSSAQGTRSAGSRPSAPRGFQSGIQSIEVSMNGRWVVSHSDDCTVRLWQLDWEYEFPQPTDWDDDAQPYLETFLTSHTPYCPDGLSRQGPPTWSEGDFRQLLTELGWRGYGWLRPDGVRARLDELARDRRS